MQDHADVDQITTSTGEKGRRITYPAACAILLEILGLITAGSVGCVFIFDGVQDIVAVKALVESITGIPAFCSREPARCLVSSILCGI